MGKRRKKKKAKRKDKRRRRRTRRSERRTRKREQGGFFFRKRQNKKRIKKENRNKARRDRVELRNARTDVKIKKKKAGLGFSGFTKSLGQLAKDGAQAYATGVTAGAIGGASTGAPGVVPTGTNPALDGAAAQVNPNLSGVRSGASPANASAGRKVEPWMIAAGAGGVGLIALVILWASSD